MDQQASITPSPTTDLEIDLGSLLQVLQRRFKYIVGATGIALLLAVVVTIRAQRVYRARAVVLIERSAPEVLGGVREVYDLGTGAYWGAHEYYQTQYSVIGSRPVAERAARRLGLSAKALAEQVRTSGAASLEARVAGDPGSDLPEAARQRLRMLRLDEITDRDDLLKSLDGFDVPQYIQRLIKVKPPEEESRLAEIVVEFPDPSIAARMANSIADAYIEFNLEQKTDATRSAVDWLSDQLHELKQKAGQSELALYEFKKANNIVSVSLEDRQSMVTETLSQMNQSLSAQRAKRAGLESRLNQIRREGDERSRESVREVIANPLIQDLKNAYSRLKREESDLDLSYTEEHPKLRAVRGKMASVRRELASEISKIIGSFEQELAATVETEQRLQAAINKTKAEALELNRKEIEYNRLRRDRDNNLALYEMVFKRQKEADLTQLLKVNNVSKLEAAQIPRKPIRPRVPLNIMMGILVGLGLGVLLAFVVDRLDNTFKGQPDVEMHLATPFLGVIPKIPVAQSQADARPTERDLYAIKHPRSSVAECCRTVRTNLLFMSAAEPARRLLVTSSGPQEGKTTAAINLAATMANSGPRVVLVDTDMRRPRVHYSFSLDNERGVTSVLLGEQTLDQVLCPTVVDNLTVLPCGPIPPNPAELLHAEPFIEMVEELSRRFDRVVLDSPPVAAVADPLVLTSMVDGVVLLIHAGKTTWPAAQQAKRRIEEVGGRLLGVVLNNVDLEKRRGGRYDNYYHYYHYQYSSSGEEKPNKAKSA